jgi:hypothetical protein
VELHQEIKMPNRAQTCVLMAGVARLVSHHIYQNWREGAEHLVNICKQYYVLGPEGVESSTLLLKSLLQVWKQTGEGREARGSVLSHSSEPT